MPRKTGTRTVAQSASITSGAAASPYYCKVPTRRSALPAIKWAAQGPPKSLLRQNATTTQLQAELSSNGGIHGDCRHAQGNGDRDGDGDGDGKQCDPHGVASSLAQMRAGSLAGKRAGPVLVPGFPGADADFW